MLNNGLCGATPINVSSVLSIVLTCIVMYSDSSKILAAGTQKFLYAR
jgi:hypothetical protein